MDEVRETRGLRLRPSQQRSWMSKAGSAASTADDDDDDDKLPNEPPSILRSSRSRTNLSRGGQDHSSGGGGSNSNSSSNGLSVGSSSGPQSFFSESIAAITTAWSSASNFDAFLERNEALVPIAILACAAFTRFYRLSLPPGVNFDESHFIRFTNQYTARTYFFDIHPPLGKLTLWAVGQIVGLNQPNPSTRPFMSLPTDCNYEHISEEFVPGCKYVYLRAVAATVSTLTVVMMYFISRNWGATVWGGILASGLLLFDMLSNIQGRLVLLDVQLSFWCTASLLLAQCWWARLNSHYDAEDNETNDMDVTSPLDESRFMNNEAASATDNAAPEPVFEQNGAPAVTSSSSSSSFSSSSASAKISSSSITNAAYTKLASYLPIFMPGLREKTPSEMSLTERTLWCLALGFFCANSFSIKMTGAVTPLMIAVESFFGLMFLKRGAMFLDLLSILFSGIFTYMFWFACHFAILTRHGDGDEEFMSEQFQSTLLESKFYNPTARWEGFLYTFYELNKRMIVHNANILAPHPWMSSWWEWVLNLRGVAYYGKDLPFTYTAAVYLIGNHAIHMLVIAGFILFFVLIGLHLRVRPFAERLMALGKLHGESFSSSDGYLASPIATARSPITSLSLSDPTIRSLNLFFASGAFCVAAYCINLIPYLGVARSTFIYHYMPALIYGELLLARVIEHIAGKHTPIAARVVLLVVGLVWLHYTPWIYGFPLTNDGHARRRWNPRWD
jgi:dolichyl-phosphate-mannose--protein O-mannosyl transferase